MPLLLRFCATLVFLALGFAVPMRSVAACEQYAHIKRWTGTFSITFDRVARRSDDEEHASGSASYTTHYSAPPFDAAVSFNGYTQKWYGKPSGSAYFVDEVTRLDGSQLSRPDRLEGSGALLADPPIGRFGPEQFWINPEKCLYAFYTSAAVHAVHTYESPSIDGTDVHVEAIAIPRGAHTWSGSRQFTLPNPSNYYGGDQFHIPCRLIDYCSRNAGPGSATISWSFVPEGVPATPKPIECPGADMNSPSAMNRLRTDFEKALVATGHAAALRDIAAGFSSGLRKVTVRLASNGEVLPSDACIAEAESNGSAKPGSLQGAHHLLIGAVQVSGMQTRVTVRTIDVATGAILSSALGDATGNGDAAIASAAATALAHLGPF